MEEEASLALPAEILHLLFHKLPIESVRRCKLVCKEWCSLISDPLLQPIYNPPKSFMLIAWDDPPALSSSTLDACFLSRQNVVHTKLLGGSIMGLGSWNGLVALYNNAHHFCLLNPNTNEEKLVHVADNLSTSLILCGLCYDPVCDEYKAIMCNSTRTFAVSFKDGSCKSKPQPESLRGLHSPPGSDKGGGVRAIVNGVPHWMCCTDAATSWRSILYYHQPTEELRAVPLPPDWNRPAGIAALDGRLAVAFLNRLSGTEIWAYGGGDEAGWSLVLGMMEGFPGYVSVFWWITEDIVFIKHCALGLFTLYDVSNRMVLLELSCSPGSLYQLLPFFPSFVSPLII